MTKNGFSNSFARFSCRIAFRSDDPSAAQNAGALGWFSQKDMDPAFAAAAFALANVGDLSEPVQSQFGWHIIRLDGKRAGTVKSYEESREQIMTELRKRAIEEKREATVSAIRRDPKAFIDRDPRQSAFAYLSR